MMAAIGDTPRVVYLPLEKLDKCTHCDTTSDLHLCSSCNEVSSSTRVRFGTRDLNYVNFSVFIALSNANSLTGILTKGYAVCMTQ